MPHDKNGREFHEGDRVSVEYTVTNITDDPDEPNEKRLTLALTDHAIPFAERVVVGCWMKPANVVVVDHTTATAAEETARVLRVLTHHDQLALAQTAGYAGSIPNLVSLAIRQAAKDVREGKDY